MASLCCPVMALGNLLRPPSTSSQMVARSPAMARPSSESDRVGISAIEGSWLAKANGVSDVPPTSSRKGELEWTAWLASPLAKSQLEPQSLSADTTVMLASAPSVKSCCTA